MTLPRSSVVALFSEAGHPLALQEVAIPKLADDELLVRIEACAICSSDLHTYTGRRQGPTPAILGHEVLGRLVWPALIQDGAGKDIRAGQRLVWSVAGCCNRCFYCKTGIPQKCEEVFKYGHEPFQSSWYLNGGLADYCVLRRGTFFMAAPDALESSVLAPTSCATATVAAVVAAAGSIYGKTVLILGAGMLGLTASAMLHSQGAAVLVSDLHAARLHKAEQFGAERVIDAGLSSADFIETVKAASGGRGADIVLELAGSNASVERALLSARIGGICVLAGSVFSQPPLPLSIEAIVRRLLTIRGVHNYAPAHLIGALQFLSSAGSRYPFAQLAEAKFSLGEVNAAFEYAIEHSPYRVLVHPEGTSLS